MPKPEGIQWEEFHSIPEQLEDYLGTDSMSSREDWIMDSKYPHTYLKDVTSEDNSEHYEVLQQQLKRAGVPDQVQITRRGTPVNKGNFRSGSIYPDWTGGSANSKYHYGQDRKLFISLVPREHIVGFGQEEEGEVFYKKQQQLSGKLD